MIVTSIPLEILWLAMPNATITNCEKFLPHLNKAFVEFEINTPMRIAHFLAQLAWESGSLNYTTEKTSGKGYEGKTILGNTKEGDGVRFKGRGLIQLTGRDNYRKYLTFALGHKLVEDDQKDEVDENKELLAAPKDATRSAGWFWKKRGLNTLADNDEFTKITYRINGSSKTVPQRLPCLRWAKIAMGLKKTNIPNSPNLVSKTAIKKATCTCRLINLSQYDIGDRLLIRMKYQIWQNTVTCIGNPRFIQNSHLCE